MTKKTNSFPWTPRELSEHIMTIRGAKAALRACGPGFRSWRVQVRHMIGVMEEQLIDFCERSDGT